MGDPKRTKKGYTTPPHPWQGVRIQAEKKILNEFGLKNKKEIWRAESRIRNYRRQARDLIGHHSEKSEALKKKLLDTLVKKGILDKDATIDNILALETRDILERRLQTVIFKKGIANTQKDARQLILHGHITIEGKKHTEPGTIINKALESKIEYAGPDRKPPELRKPEARKKEERGAAGVGSRQPDAGAPKEKEVPKAETAEAKK